MKDARNGLPVVVGALVALLCVSLAVPPALADYEQAMSYFRQKKYVEAAAEFEALLSNAPDWDYGYFMLGTCYLQLRKYRDAEQQYRKAIELNNSKFPYHLNLAQALLQLKKYDDVVVTLDRAEDLAATDREKRLLRKFRGLALARVKDYARAIEDLNAVNDGKDYAVAAELGRVCYTVGKYACAVKALEQAIALKKDDARSLKLLSQAHLESARKSTAKAQKAAEYRKAAEAARRLLALEPDSTEGHELLGAALLGADDFAGAIAEFEAVLAREPKNCTAMLNIAQAYPKLEKWDKVLEWGKKAAECDPKSYLAYNQIAFAYNKMHRWDDAEAAASKALSLKDNPSSRQQLEIARKGREAEETNRRAEAERIAYEKALEEQRRREEEERRRIEEYKIRTGQAGTSKPDAKSGGEGGGGAP
ncbi:MAG: tetratricopeptide repeat protein [Acidobacteria bacterium]|nr:MAG: tetratricopeptide repeat protein [Acidobacteriota bacterium]